MENIRKKLKSAEEELRMITKIANDSVDSVKKEIDKLKYELFIEKVSRNCDCGYYSVGHSPFYNHIKASEVTRSARETIKYDIGVGFSYKDDESVFLKEDIGFSFIPKFKKGDIIRFKDKHVENLVVDSYYKDNDVSRFLDAYKYNNHGFSYAAHENKFELQPIIEVPDNIKIQFHASKKQKNAGDRLAIIMNDNQRLAWLNGAYKVYGLCKDQETVKCKLIMVNTEDRKIGYTYYRTDVALSTHNVKYNYCKYLGNDRIASITNVDGVLVNNSQCEYWYQVVPVDKSTRMDEEQ